MPDLHVVLFVEGSRGLPQRGGGDPFEHLWTDVLARALRLRSVARVVPISKKNLITPAQAPLRATSSMAVPLDELLKREIDRGKCDAAVVAWDLQPKWDKSVAACRRTETLDLYSVLAGSPVLPPAWREAAQRRHDRVAARGSPANVAPPALAHGVTLAVCMEPDFEALLCDDGVVRRAIGLGQKRIRDWPTDWALAPPACGDDLLQCAVLAAQRMRPQPASVKRVRGDMRTAKHEWAAYILRQLSGPDLLRVRGHPIARRLQACLGRER